MSPSQPSVESQRLLRAHLPERAGTLGMSVRAADLQLKLDGTDHGLQDTTHFDTVRFPPPDWALPTFAAAASDGNLAYTAYRGDHDVRQICAPAISKLLGVDVDPERNLALTTGTQGGLFSVLSALINEGDVVVLTDPEYLFVERMLRFLGATVVRLPLVDSIEDGPQLDLAELEGAAKAGIRMLVTSNPNNPTGAVYSAATISAVAALAIKYDFSVMIDELYCRLVYGGTDYHHLVAEPGMLERTVTLLGGSKTESLSGYRVGVVVGPEAVIEAVEQVLAMCCLRAPAYSQQVLTKWLIDDEEFVRDRVLELHSIRDHTVSTLRKVPGLRVEPGRGTAYLWVDVSDLGLTDIEMARLLQVEAGVVVSPGYQFGPSGKGRFRICYAREEETWKVALDRIVAVLSSLQVAGTR